MAAQVIPFDFESREVRTLLIDDQPWFVATDISSALKYSVPSAMTRHLDEDEKGVSTVHTPGGYQEVTVINESGLYSAILRSRKAEAKRFKKWVTAEVLPAIRKHGRYEDRNDQMGSLMMDAVGVSELTAIKGVIKDKAKQVVKDKRRSFMQAMHQRLHTRFNVPRTELIPHKDFAEACNFIAAYAIEGEWLGKDDTEDAEAADLFNRVARQRWKELEALTVQQDKLIKRQEALQDEQRQISKQITNACRSLYDPIFESTRRLNLLTGGVKAEDGRVQSFIDMQNRCRAH